MTLALEKIIMVDTRTHINEHVKVINIFHDVNSSLYTVTKIHIKTGILLKVINLFRNENLTLFTLTNIHSIQNVQET